MFGVALSCFFHMVFPYSADVLEEFCVISEGVDLQHGTARSHKNDVALTSSM